MPVSVSFSVPGFRFSDSGRWQWQLQGQWAAAVAATGAADRRRDRGMAKEVDSHLRLLARAGVVDGACTVAVLATFDEVRAMTWRLLNPKE